MKQHRFISSVAVRPAARPLPRVARRPLPLASTPFVEAPPLVPELPIAMAAAPDLHDETGHHRYYGLSACP